MNNQQAYEAGYAAAVAAIRAENAALAAASTSATGAPERQPAQVLAGPPLKAETDEEIKIARIIEFSGKSKASVTAQITEIKANSARLVAAARTADRQARERARKRARKTANWGTLNEQQKEDLLTEYEEDIINERHRTGAHADGKVQTILDDEAKAIEKIEDEVLETQLSELLGYGGEAHDSGSMKTRSKDESENDLPHTRKLRDIFKANLQPLIERHERWICALGEPDVDEVEMVKFRQQVDNPADVARFLKGGKDLEDFEKSEDQLKQKKKNEDNDDDEVEVVVSDDESNTDSDEDEDMTGFIVESDEDDE